MNNRYTIWCDQDATIYNMNEEWCKLHNDEFPEHTITVDQMVKFDMEHFCKDAGCSGNMLHYFNDSRLWSNGDIIDNADTYIEKWIDIADVCILTTVANSISMPYKMEWLKTNFPFVKNVIMVNTHLKHLVRGDILIDDGLHNLEHFQGVRILYDQPWNQLPHEKYIRAKGWANVDKLVRRAILLLDKGYEHCQIERFIKLEQKEQTEQNEF